MKRYHIVFKNEKWVFAHALTGRAIMEFSTKEPAIKWAADYISRTSYGGSLIVHKKDGTFQDEFTYPRKIDPRKSKG